MSGAMTSDSGLVRINTAFPPCSWSGTKKQTTVTQSLSPICSSIHTHSGRSIISTVLKEKVLYASSLLATSQTSQI